MLGNSLLLETVATVAHLASYLSARDLCYLAKTCRAVSASLPWSEVAAHAAAASGLGGASGVGCARSMAAWYAKHSLAIDRGTAFGSRLSGAGRTCAELHLGGPQHGLRAAAAEAAEEQDELSLRPSLYRVATAVTSVGFSSRLARSISWSVRLVRLPQLDGVGLWLGIMYDKRGSAPAEEAPLPAAGGGGPLHKQEEHLLTRETLSTALSPYRYSGPVDRFNVSERWADSNWALLALGSNGYVQVSGTTPRSFSRRLAVGDVVRVTVDFQANQLLFGLNGGQPRIAAKRLLPRGVVPPLRVHAAVTLTDITKPLDEDESEHAAVELFGFERDAAAGTFCY